ncbi:hypothetical protein [Sphingomonas adhaesiva]|uniref:hypothetical protein n=1 Tax=Sphingomonas adhaesiva TaxID=28212 RepID=UPI002FFAA6A3
MALAVLRGACRSGPEAARQSEAIRLALRVLLPHVNRRTLSTFWTCADNANAAQRSLVLQKILRLIEADVMRAMTR